MIALVAVRAFLASGNDSCIFDPFRRGPWSVVLRDPGRGAIGEDRQLIVQGQRVEVVQRVPGHRDIRSTLGDADLQESQVRAALERPALR